MTEIPQDIAAELARLRAENAWLLRLLKFSPQQAVPPRGPGRGYPEPGLRVTACRRLPAWSVKA